MTTTTVRVAGVTLDVYSINTLVIGSGAASLNAAISLHERGQHDLVIATEAWGGGTSANAGSDKQTYYKLSLSGRVPDSPHLMADDLFAGGCMHGDIALSEAQLSAQAFYHLVQLGVPFPHDRHGGFTGYRTDHDQRGRATSAGPLTSRLMVERLSAAVRERGIAVFEPVQVVSLLVDEGRQAPRIAGAIGLDISSCAAGEPRFVLFNAVNVIFGAGGPGGMYLDSVYPPEQTGSIGLALRIGAIAQNLTESQFGLASIAPRWNVSGSYQQVVPRYVSTAPDGGDAREFLDPAFAGMGALGTAIFRKGYQWPFDPRRVRGGGSSLIDLLVYRERVARGRRVFLDFTRNIGGDATTFSLDVLHEEARSYLEKCGATGATPFERLAAMNQPAIDLYRSRGIDLARDWLEIAVCAQHNNGGLRGDIWWESNIEGLFPVGEVNGSHGVRRPGGASLNAGQVGGLRAATRIAVRRGAEPRGADEFVAACADAISRTLDLAHRMSTNGGADRREPGALTPDIQRRMSRAGGHVRDLGIALQAAAEAWALERDAPRLVWAPSPSHLPAAFRALDQCLAHAIYLDAIVEYLRQGGQSRGSFLVVDQNGEPAATGDDELCRFTLDAPESFVGQHILEVALAPEGGTTRTWVPVRPIPEADAWFESVWKAFREGTTFD